MDPAESVRLSASLWSAHLLFLVPAGPGFLRVSPRQGDVLLLARPLAAYCFRVRWPVDAVENPPLSGGLLWQYPAVLSTDLLRRELVLTIPRPNRVAVGSAGFGPHRLVLGTVQRRQAAPRSF